jgi:ribosomal protein S18 acetylase RimI-like enzyme
MPWPFKAQRLVVCRLDLAGFPDLHLPEFQDIRFPLLDGGHEALWRRAGLTNLEEIATRAADPALGCCACLRGRELVGFSWFTLEPCREPATGFLFIPEASEAYLFDAWIRPDLREQGLTHQALSRLVHDHLAPQGIRSIISFHLHDNLPAAGMHRGLGSREVGEVQAWRLGPFRGFNERKAPPREQDEG